MRLKHNTKKIVKVACATLAINCLPSVSAIQIPYSRFITTTELPSLIKPVTRMHNNHIHYAPAQLIRQVRPLTMRQMLNTPTSARKMADGPSVNAPPLVSSDGTPSASSLVSRILQVFKFFINFCLILNFFY